MKTELAIDYFGSKAAIADALGIKKSAVSQWGETIPRGRAYQIEVLTGGQLKAELTTTGKRHIQHVDRTTAPHDFPCVKRAIATATALSNNDPQQPTPCVKPHE